ncbi:uncharacterized protein METZ01_LOCUS263861 [marine metagenome]|uniref:Uncharacterized protein n=1 Tax=marine metagenome TaxID=408172 RepID=A0A382JIN7_9ZZZZ
MSANWLIHIDHQTLKTECVDRTEGDTRRAPKASILINFENGSSQSRHIIWSGSLFVRVPLPCDFQ